MSTAFGNYLRGARLGYRPLPNTEPTIFMRIAPSGDGWWLVQFARTAKEMSKMASYDTKYVVWWEGDYTRLQLSSLALRTFNTSRVPCQLLVNDAGEEFKPK